MPAGLLDRGRAIRARAGAKVGELAAPIRRSTFGKTVTDPVFLRVLRLAASAVYVVALYVQIRYHGIPFDRTGLLVWIAIGLICLTIGRRAPWSVIVDFLPFAAVLVAYDYLRGAADSMGMPTWWTPQITVEKFLFAGHIPTVWLQEHFYYNSVRWWDIAVCVTYFSFFFLPYLTAGVLWLRSRHEFRRWGARFVTLSFLGFALFALIPSAPPWAAARCTPAEVADHPHLPACIADSSFGVPNGGLLGTLSHPRPGISPYVERGLATRGWSRLHLSAARSLLESGQQTVDLVAAVPSLHCGGTVLFVLFFWKRTPKILRPLLALYPVVMALSLAYAAEHYIVDCLAGGLCAWLVHACFNRWERRADRRRKQRADAGNLEGSPSPTTSRMETECPPARSAALPEMTPSSTSPSDGDSSSRPPTSTAEAGRPGTTVRSASN